MVGVIPILYFGIDWHLVVGVEAIIVGFMLTDVGLRSGRKALFENRGEILHEVEPEEEKTPVRWGPGELTAAELEARYGRADGNLPGSSRNVRPRSP